MYKVNKTVLITLLVSLLTAGLLIVGCSRGFNSVGGIKEGFNVGNLAPNFSLQSIDGKLVTLDYYRGRPVMLNFWASWCGPCRAEMPLIQAISADKDLADKGLIVLTIDLSEELKTVQSFIISNGYTFTVLLDAQQSAVQAYNIGSIPATFFIDKEGIIKNVRIGAFAYESQIRTELSKMLK